MLDTQPLVGNREPKKSYFKKIIIGIFAFALIFGLYHYSSNINSQSTSNTDLLISSNTDNNCGTKCAADCKKDCPNVPGIVCKSYCEYDECKIPAFCKKSISNNMINSFDNECKNCAKDCSEKCPGVPGIVCRSNCQYDNCQIPVWCSAPKPKPKPKPKSNNNNLNNFINALSDNNECPQCRKECDDKCGNVPGVVCRSYCQYDNCQIPSFCNGKPSGASKPKPKLPPPPKKGTINNDEEKKECPKCKNECKQKCGNIPGIVCESYCKYDQCKIPAFCNGKPKKNTFIKKMADNQCPQCRKECNDKCGNIPGVVCRSYCQYGNCQIPVFCNGKPVSASKPKPKLPTPPKPKQN